MIYKFFENPQKELREPTFDFAMIYYTYGYCLVENDKRDEAEIALLTAHKWAPANTKIMYELAEIYKSEKKYDEFITWTKKAMQYAYIPEELARGYRNLGYYYIDMKNYQLAADLFYFSRIFENCTIVNSELFFISEKIGQVPKHSDFKTFKAALDKEKIQLGANDDVVSLIYQMGKIYKENNDLASAAEFYMIAYDLTHDERILKTIEDLKRNMN